MDKLSYFVFLEISSTDLRDEIARGLKQPPTAAGAQPGNSSQELLNSAQDKLKQLLEDQGSPK